MDERRDCGKRAASPTNDTSCNSPKRQRLTYGNQGGRLWVRRGEGNKFDLWKPNVFGDAMEVVGDALLTFIAPEKDVGFSKSSVSESHHAGLAFEASRSPSPNDNGSSMTTSTQIDDATVLQQHVVSAPVPTSAPTDKYTSSVSHVSAASTSESSTIGTLVWRIVDASTRTSCTSFSRSRQTTQTLDVLSGEEAALRDPHGQHTLMSPCSPIPCPIPNAWDVELYTLLLDVFHHESFRPHQQDTMNATLSGKDVTVEWPTGAGKSLCYQLPALCTTGKTRGVSVIISPLLSLITDQELHLLELGVNVFSITGENKDDDLQKAEALRRIAAIKPALLYTTAEKFDLNLTIRTLINDLYAKKQLARFVIDEAHCVSDWGYDFRTSYAKLSCIRQNYPDIPIMALTAAIKSSNLDDIIDHLGIKGCQIIRQSSNRPNLFYEVRAKTAGKAGELEALKEIQELIRASYDGQPGIIYCQSQKACENVAASLTAAGLPARHYHAGLQPTERRAIQQAWKENGFDIVVATTAFGMGIDKANVRFVIHHSLPRSLQNYYQETGRAGRDGLDAICILYHRFEDFDAMKKRITREGSRVQQKLEDLLDVVRYAITLKQCRRTQLLGYFEEKFHRNDCQKMCDNCRNMNSMVNEDVSEAARQILRLVRDYQECFQCGITIPQALDILCGSSRAKDGARQLTNYGTVQPRQRDWYKTILYCLLISEAVRERIQKTGHKEEVACYIVCLADLGAAILNRTATFHVQISLPSSPEGTRHKRLSRGDVTAARNSSNKKQSGLKKLRGQPRKLSGATSREKRNREPPHRSAKRQLWPERDEELINSEQDIVQTPTNQATASRSKPREHSELTVIVHDSDAEDDAAETSARPASRTRSKRISNHVPKSSVKRLDEEVVEAVSGPTEWETFRSLSSTESAPDRAEKTEAITTLAKLVLSGLLAAMTETGPELITLAEAVEVLKGKPPSQSSIKVWPDLSMFGTCRKQFSFMLIRAVTHRLDQAGCFCKEIVYRHNVHARPFAQLVISAVSPKGLEILSGKQAFTFPARMVTTSYRSKNDDRAMYGLMNGFDPLRIDSDVDMDAYDEDDSESGESSSEVFVDDRSVHDRHRSEIATRARSRASKTGSHQHKHIRATVTRTQKESYCTPLSITPSSSENEEDSHCDPASSGNTRKSGIAARAQVPACSSGSSRSNATCTNTRDASDIKEAENRESNNTPPSHSEETRSDTDTDFDLMLTTDIAKLAISGIQSALEERGSGCLTFSRAWHVLKGHYQGVEFRRDGWGKLSAFGICKQYSLLDLKEVVHRLDACGAFRTETVPVRGSSKSTMLVITELRRAGLQILSGKKELHLPERIETASSRGADRCHEGRVRRRRAQSI